MSMPMSSQEPEEEFDAVLYVRVPGAWKEAIDREARATDRSKAGMYRALIKSGMHAHGVIPGWHGPEQGPEPEPEPEGPASGPRLAPVMRIDQRRDRD